MHLTSESVPDRIPVPASSTSSARYRSLTVSIIAATCSGDIGTTLLPAGRGSFTDRVHGEWGSSRSRGSGGVREHLDPDVMAAAAGMASTSGGPGVKIADTDDALGGTTGTGLPTGRRLNPAE